MRVSRILLLGGLALAVVAAFVLLARNVRLQGQSLASSTSPVTVAASFYPLAEFARNVGGDEVTVTQITPTGVDAHDFQLSPQHILAIRSAKLFLYNGGGVEPWAERVHEDTERHGVRVISMIEALGFQARSAADTGGVNPHLWLDPVLVKQHVEIIRDTLTEVGPAHAAAYKENAERYLKELDALDAAFRAGLASCTSRTVIVAHDAFRRLTERYGLELLPLAGLSPEDEARPRHLADVFQRARRENIRTVFPEVLVSSRVIETFAQEIGAEIRPLHPLEGLTQEELAAGKTYLSVMQENLAALRVGLGCH
jgi:zinc transport system substrate-binding protein